MSTDTGSLEKGAASEKETSLHDDIAAAMDASESAESSTGGEGKDVGADKGSPDVSEAARTLAAAKKGASTADGASAPEGAKPPQDEASAKRAAELAAMSPEDRAKAEAASVDAPQHWPARDREFFAKQAPEVRNWLLGRHKAMEADYTRRVQEVAHYRRERDELGEIFRPFADAMASDGMTVPMAVRQLVAAHHMLIRDPANGIASLAQKYGIDLKKATEDGAQQGQSDPRFATLEGEVRRLQSTLQGQLNAQVENEKRTNLSKVEQFAEEKDAQGKPLRPHFDDVARDISMLLRAAREAGDSLTLQDAYDRAIYANPQVRQKVLAALDAERRAKDDDDRKRKANAARTAGFDVKGEGAATSVAATTDSIRGDLEAAFAQTGGRV